MRAKTLTSAALVSLLLLCACKVEHAQVAGQKATGSEWQRPPSIENAHWNGLAVALSGSAEPNGRVVLSSGEGVVYAANADANGKFVIELNAPPNGIALKPRAQIGQAFVDGQGVLYLVPGEPPLAVTVFEGEASHRLGPAGALDSVDSDGAVLILSGHARGKTGPQVRVGGQSFNPVPDQEGRWQVATSGGASAISIAVGDKTYAFPGLGTPESPPAIVSGGWLLTRNLGGKAVQTTWLPVDM